MKRKAAMAVVALVAAFMLTACGGPDHGTVHDKSHSPEQWISTTYCHPVGKVTVCNPQMVHHPESWSLDVYNGDEHGWVDVTEETYDSYNVGDFVDFREEK